MHNHIKASVDWSYYNAPKFKEVEDAYLPATGEGDTMANQMITAVTKLVYKWYNDGDVFDNNYGMEGWANDLSSYANWLYRFIDGTASILNQIRDCYNDNEYEGLLQDLADYCFSPDVITLYADQPKAGSIYNCDGPFEFTEYSEDEEDEYDEYDEDEDEWY